MDGKTVRMSQRIRQSSCAFCQLRQFVQFKAAREGIVVIAVDSRNTGRGYPVCDYTGNAAIVARAILLGGLLSVCQAKERKLLTTPGLIREKLTGKTVEQLHLEN